MIAGTATRTISISQSVPIPAAIPTLGYISANAYLRLLGAAAIVWFHTAPGGPLNFIGGIGLGIFLCLSFLHAGQPRDFWTTLTRRGSQLLVPLVFWFLIYAAISFWRARGVPPEFGPSASIWTRLAWPSIHLWYLPTVFVATLVVWLGCRIAAPLQAGLKAVLALVMGLIPLSLLVVVPELPSPAAQVVSSLPAIGVGLAYGYCLRMEGPRKRLWYFLAIAALVAVSSVPLWFTGDRMVAIAATGCTLLMTACALPLPRHRILIRMSSLTPGIFLSHPFAMVVLWKLLGADHPHWFFALATLVLAALMTWAMRQIRFLRVMV